MVTILISVQNGPDIKQLRWSGLHINTKQNRRHISHWFSWPEIDATDAAGDEDEDEPTTTHKALISELTSFCIWMVFSRPAISSAFFDS